MSVDIAIVDSALDTSTGDIDFTKSGFGTPKAALFFATYATANGTAVADAGLMIAAASGTSNQSAHFVSDEDGQNPTDTHRDNDAAVANHTTPGSSAQDGLADFVSFITDGVRINVSNAFASAYKMKVILFGGDDLSAHVGQVDLEDTGNNTINVTAPGFDADVVIGFAHLEGALQQRHIHRQGGAWPRPQHRQRLHTILPRRRIRQRRGSKCKHWPADVRPDSI